METWISDSSKPWETATRNRWRLHLPTQWLLFRPGVESETCDLISCLRLERGSIRCALVNLQGPRPLRMHQVRAFFLKKFSCKILEYFKWGKWNSESFQTIQRTLWINACNVLIAQQLWHGNKEILEVTFCTFILLTLCLKMITLVWQRGHDITEDRTYRQDSRRIWSSWGWSSWYHCGWSYSPDRYPGNCGLFFHPSLPILLFHPNSILVGYWSYAAAKRADIVHDEQVTFFHEPH